MKLIYVVLYLMSLIAVGYAINIGDIGLMLICTGLSMCVSYRIARHREGGV